MASAADVRGGPSVLRHENYSINLNHRLGSGAFGVVYMGEDTSTRTQICAKHLHIGSVEFSQTEIDNMRWACGHANIVTIYDHFIYMNDSWIVMEYCQGDTLNVHMRNHDQNIQSRVKMIHQVTDAVKHLHTLAPRIAHRDLKPQNIIISPGLLVKVCDFGLSKTIDVTGSMNASTLGGTQKYMPPELHMDIVKYDAFKADMFSLGLIFLGTITCSKGGSMTAFFTLAPGKAIGKLMYEQRLSKKPVNALRKKIVEFTHTNSDVMRLMTFLTNMIAYTPLDRVNIHEVMTIVADVHQKVCVDPSVETSPSPPDIAPPSPPKPRATTLKTRPLGEEPCKKESLGKKPRGKEPPRKEPPRKEPPRKEPPRKEPPGKEPPRNEPPRKEPPRKEPPRKEPPRKVPREKETHGKEPHGNESRGKELHEEKPHGKETHLIETHGRRSSLPSSPGAIPSSPQGGDARGRSRTLSLDPSYGTPPRACELPNPRTCWQKQAGQEVEGDV